MAYRNGTYIAFAADGETDPTKSDIKYYNILKGWDSMKSKDFKFINSHEKVSACRDTSSKETIKRSLRERLQNSKNILLLVGNTTRFDTDFVPYELSYGIEECKLPIICCYVKEDKRITGQFNEKYKNLLPKLLLEKINKEEVRTIHIPFREEIILKSINEIDFQNPPMFFISFFKDSIYNNLGIL